ncbi:acetolactate synthase large subunit [Amycolatopsis keratiniphila]|uniref:Acetolactate synthase large subunit n=1 Tax=Amycolatopsis keratiniphila subsp. keratiniphila TaxID=227715 RepID=A0A1W2M1L2_9PSEU|nr:acetolactate synthase large subunit [Amycolatopsis keratiniphila]ONF73733.1 acetolactate synthase large subunit [Amycolatopsis keratiniphila subsp. keratiniphila]
MNGAQVVMETLGAAGVGFCFTNPGTSEMHLVAEMATRPSIRNVLCLFEGVATGAADGYGRMAGKPAATLLHLGPGLGNGLANLHNARRAATPLVNLVGDHATYHKAFDPPLDSDIESMAGTVSTWVRRTTSVEHVGSDIAEALVAARTGRGVATLILPSDVCWSAGGSVAPIPAIPPDGFDADEVERVAKVLRNEEGCLLFVGGAVMRRDGLRAARRIARATGTRLLAEKSPARHERGGGIPDLVRLPYPVDEALGTLRGYRHIVFAGARPPVAFFAYPGKPSELVSPETEVHELGQSAAALEYLAELIAAGELPDDGPRARPGMPTGGLTAEAVAAVTGALLPEGAVLVDESMTSGQHLPAATADAPWHDWLSLTGGSIGMGTPAATGAALACPDRPVICFVADGSAMYTPQSWWTQARESLNVTTVILNNSSYAILAGELGRVGTFTDADLDRAREFIDISGLDFVSLAAGMGIPGARVDTAEGFAGKFREALAEPGPHLIEAVIPPVAAL